MLNSFEKRGPSVNNHEKNKKSIQTNQHINKNADQKIRSLDWFPLPVFMLYIRKPSTAQICPPPPQQQNRYPILSSSNNRDDPDRWDQKQQSYAVLPHRGWRTAVGNR